MKKILGLVLMMGLLTSASAFAKANVSLVGALDYGLNSASVEAFGQKLEMKGDLGFGGGLLVGFGGPSVGFEFGGVFLSRKIKMTATDLATGLSASDSATGKGIHIPGTVRFPLGKVVSLGLGGFYDISLEDDGEADYGATGGLRFNFSPNFFLDGRYNMGLKDFDGEKSKEVLALIGFTFGGK